MAKTSGKNQDYLGLLALGSAISVIGNLAQAKDRQDLKVSLDRLKEMYDLMLGRYRMLQREYGALRTLNDRLQQQVIELREENNRLLARPADKPQGVKT